jgi:hypothetical protein
MNITRDDDRIISIDCKGFRKILVMKVRALAAEQYRDILLNRIKKENNLRGKGYTVS